MELLAPQVEEAIAQASLLGELGIAVHLKGQWLRRRLHHQLLDRQLDLARRQLRVHGRRRARHDLARDGDFALEPQRLGDPEERARAVEHALGDAIVVPEIEEQQVAVIALAVEPAREPGRDPGVLTAELATRVRSEASHRRRSSGLISASPEPGRSTAYEPNPSPARSSSCRARFFRLSVSDTTRSPLRSRLAADTTSGSGSSRSNRNAMRSRSGGALPLRSSRIDTTRSNPIENPHAGTSWPRSRPTIRS